MDIRTYAGRFEQAASVLCFIIIRENQGRYREFGGLMGNYPFFMLRVKMDGLGKMCVMKVHYHKQEGKFERLQGSFSCLG